ncbi:ATPase, AAA family, partial [Cooperia oncophora]
LIVFFHFSHEGRLLLQYVGESESNVRKLFADAEEEWRRCGSNSGLHIIIFDEIDAICKQRGSMAGSSSVHDTVVNQLLSKMDGVEQLNNILKLDPEVNLEELAKRTKNFSGAEIEGLVRAAQSSAMNRLVKAGGKVQLDPDAIEKLVINAADFEYALENDIKPAFGRSDESLEKFLRRGMVVWGSEVTRILEEGARLVEETVNPDAGGFVTAVLAGPPRSGKSFLAAEIARTSDFPLIKVVSPGDMVGFSESAKCQCLRKAFADAFRSKLSVLLIDNIERLLDYSPVGPRFSNLVLQALLVLLNEPPSTAVRLRDHRLLVLATSSNRSFLRELEIVNAFGGEFCQGVVKTVILGSCDEMCSPPYILYEYLARNSGVTVAST